MAKNMKRALRRHHRARMQRRAYKKLFEDWYWIFNWRGKIQEGDLDDEEKRKFHRIVSMHRDNLAICSCSACGNRRHSGWASEKESLTMQERRQEERWKSELEELDLNG